MKGTKGKKDRVTLLSQKAKELLLQYQREYRSTDYVFEGQYGENIAIAACSRYLSGH
ncbi:MAG: hypothetical protein AAF944_01600 [Bacteroidota bacterium]